VSGWEYAEAGVARLLATKLVAVRPQQTPDAVSGLAGPPVPKPHLDISATLPHSERTNV